MARDRSVERRLDGLLDEPRCGAPRRVTDDRVAAVVVRTLGSLPRGQTHWGTRRMAADGGRRRAGPDDGRPHLAGVRVAPAPDGDVRAVARPAQFAERVRDVVGLYTSPPANAVVLCADEKSQVRASDRTQPLPPPSPGRAGPSGGTHDYARRGATSLFAALNAATGRVASQLHRRHRSAESRTFPDAVDAAAPAGPDVHLVMDNYGTHKTAPIRDWLAKRPRFHCHFTPTHSSWLNLVERPFAEVTGRCVRRGSHRSTAALEAAIRAYLAPRPAKPFVWTKAADAIPASIERFAARTLETHPADAKRTSRAGH